jgi:hypothetical protein
MSSDFPQEARGTRVGGARVNRGFVWVDGFGSTGRREGLGACGGTLVEERLREREAV